MTDETDGARGGSSGDRALRRHLVHLLASGAAHLTFTRVTAGIPAELRGVRPPGLPKSAWEILEHMRIAQWDILEFSRGPGHASPEWPRGYWPEPREEVDGAAWRATVDGLRGDLDAFQDLVLEGGRDLYAELPWGEGQTLLREALLLADHNAYHLGQVVDVRRVLGCWPPPE